MTTMIEGRAPAAQNLPGEEDLRFIRNFHDLFLSLGILMFAVGLGLATTIALGPTVTETFRADGDKWRQGLAIVAAAAGVNAVIMWLMAEFFARGRRLFLPSIVILLAFTGFFFIAAGATYGAVSDIDVSVFRQLDQPADGVARLELNSLIRMGSKAAVIVYGATTIAIFAFYARMKLPFAMGLGAYWLATVGTGAAFYAWPEKAQSLFEPSQMVGGIFLFLLGVFHDARDPARQTRISDNGFWLHFFAAPLILNSAVSMVVGYKGWTQNPEGAAGVTLLIVLGFALVSLLINRRALLVAGLLYALIAGGFLISRTGLSEGWTAAITLLVLGAAMVLLGGGWHALRRIVVAPFPKTGLIARIIPPEPPKEQAVSE